MYQLLNQDLKAYSSQTNITKEKTIRMMKTLTREDPLIEEIFDLISQKSEGSDFRFELDKRMIRTSAGNINLESKQKVFQLFQFFCLSRQKEFNRSELAQELYTIKDRASMRLKESSHHNVVKLLSRARSLCKRFLASNHGSHEIDWFPYDHHSKTWSLMRLVPLEN